MTIIVAKAMADLATLLFNLIFIYVSLFGEQSGVATAFNHHVVVQSTVDLFVTITVPIPTYVGIHT